MRGGRGGTAKRLRRQARMSGPLRFEATPDCVGEALKIFWVGRNYEIVASQRPFGDTGVDYVGCARRGGEGADGTRPVIVEGLDIASAQELGEQGLAPTSTPPLGNDRRRHRRYRPKCEEGPVPGPRPPLTPVGGDQRTRVVGHAHQAVRRDAAPVRRDRLTASDAQVSASASSVSVKAPFARSNSATPSRPSWRRNSLRAAAASQAL